MNVLADYESLSRAACEAVLAAGQEAVRVRERFDLVLAGGSTPRRTCEFLAEALKHDTLLRTALHVWWSDERCVPPENVASNYFQCRSWLTDPAGLPTGRVHRIRGEARDREAEAARYAAEFPATVDVLMLGIGMDGHTASLFPHSLALCEMSRRFAPSVSPIKPFERITLTPSGLKCARRVMVIVSGADKAEALARIFADGGRVEDTPDRKSVV